MPPNLKIAIVSPVLPERGGMGNVAANHARLLAARGREVTVLTPDYSSRFLSTPHPRIKCGAGSTLSSVRRGDFKIPSPFKGEGQGEGSERSDFKSELLKPILQYGNAAWVPGLGRRLGSFDAVILHYPFFGGAGAVYRAKKKYGFKLIVYYHMDAVGSGFKKIIFDYNTRYFLPRLISRADLVLTSSEDLARHSYLGRYWQEGNKKFAIVPIGVDVDFFRPGDSIGNEKIVLFIGMLDAAHYFKGVEYLIKAVALTRHADPELDSGVSASNLQENQIPKQVRDDGGFKLVIVGSGDLLPAYQKLARDLGVGDKIVFAGQKFGADLLPYFQRATVTVLPSVSSESFGIALVESMAAAAPVIATDLPGPRSVYEEGVSGFTVPVRDSRALAEKIEYLLSNPAKAREMGAAGRRLVEEKYDWEKIGDKLCTLLV